ncbi:hypothetical protein BC629DRAFT_522450 [Irpex lacteus]|nr:hypothetical protein BC629DRAFT_522450 [Irpex lacteus]
MTSDCKKQRCRKGKRKMVVKRDGSASDNVTGFKVGFPLRRVRDLPGGSVYKSFRARDLASNNIVAVTLEELMRSPAARFKSVYELSRRPLYFNPECAKKLNDLVRSLHGTTASAMLKIGVELLPSDTLPVLNMCVLEEIERAMKQTCKPHRLESSQNSEDTLKSLLKPVLHSLGWGNIVVTTGYSWREAISLRSSADDGNHEYSPKSDMAILDDHGEDTLETVLLLFEAYSEAGQKRSTPDEDRTDRVRLILQASHLARKYSRPSVALYLTRNNDMETIIVFPTGGKSEGEGFRYYSEKEPFYSKASYVNVLARVINLVWIHKAQR